MIAAPDRRVTAARPDLADERYQGVIAAERYVAGLPARVVAPCAPLRRRPAVDAPLDTEALMGEAVRVFEERDGHAWVQLERDGYVGYLPAGALAERAPAPTHRVCALRTFVYPGPDLKLPPLSFLSLGAEVAASGPSERGYVPLASGGFVFAAHLAPVETAEADFVAVAERFVGTPYLWGGKSSLGIDCSGLVQLALAAAGIEAPRDSDQQEAQLGEELPSGAALRRGDLVFWRGHVGIMVDGERLLHANGHHMAVAIEMLTGACARIEGSGNGPVTRLRRLPDARRRPTCRVPVPIVSHPDYEASLPVGHRFPMGKYGSLARRLTMLGLAPGGFVAPEPAAAETIALAHDRRYVDSVIALDVPAEIEKRIGLPVTEAVVRRACRSAGGTLLAARLALAHGLAGSTAGGSHHGQRATGAGFCVFNDVAIAARALQAAGEIRRALVVDLDVHQGDGTADCLAGDPDLFTFSMHAEKNYPVRKIAGDLDVGLPDGLGDEDYMEALARHLPRLLDGLSPDLVFYNAGVDPHDDDRLGRLSLTDDGLRRRDAYVVREARQRGVPLVSVVGGGYTQDIEMLGRRHAYVFEAMAAVT